MTFRIGFVLIILLGIGSGNFLQAQSRDSVKIGFLPALGYSSDTGFIGGGVLQRAHYEEGKVPFRNMLQASGIATTKGLFSLSVQYDQLETFNRQIRTRSILNFGRIKEATYFGFGNDTPFDKSRFEDSYYFYETYFGVAELYARKKIWGPAHGGRGQLDIVAVTNLSTQQPQVEQTDNLLSETRPRFVDGLWVWETGTGLVWENRDSEFAPSRGNKARLEFRLAPGLFMDNSSRQIQFEAAQYVTQKILIFPVTAAIKVGYHQSWGDTPFWRMPRVGGEFSMRGYADGRYIGDAALYYTTELRTWLIQFPEYEFRLGGQLFMDGGRVFEQDRITHDFFKSHKRTFGLGAAMSVFSNDFIVRADLGFSDELSRFYLGIGYTF